MIPKKAQDVAGLAAFALLVMLAAGLGTVAMRPGTMAWYATLAKPSWNPPSWLFGPVWTVLYAMIAVSGWLVWRHRGDAPVFLPLAVFVVQLVLNSAWTALFFGMRRPDLGMLDIALLLLAIALNIILFWRVSLWAALLLVPYLAWVAFASVLNFTLWRLNAP